MDFMLPGCRAGEGPCAARPGAGRILRQGLARRPGGRGWGAAVLPGPAGSDAAGNLAPFFQEAGRTTYRSPRQLCSGAINGYTLMDLGLVAPPTASALAGYAAAAAGYDVKLAVSYDGSTPALVVHGSPPSGDFQGERGAIPFACQVLPGGQIYLNNDNTANQAVKVTGWRE
jgi:hypothetical protein